MKRCKRCVLPESYPGITFNEEGVCNFCLNYRDIEYLGDEAYHYFSFSDDGMGIKKKDKERIFGRFQRSELSRGTAGSGLGLAIVKEIAKGHQGRVWVSDNEEKGVTFHISVSRSLRLN